MQKYSYDSSDLGRTELVLIAYKQSDTGRTQYVLEAVKGPKRYRSRNFVTTNISIGQINLPTLCQCSQFFLNF